MSGREGGTGRKQGKQHAGPGGDASSSGSSTPRASDAKAMLASIPKKKGKHGAPEAPNAAPDDGDCQIMEARSTPRGTFQCPCRCSERPSEPCPFLDLLPPLHPSRLLAASGLMNDRAPSRPSVPQRYQGGR
jgi:hypothetical protein